MCSGVISNKREDPAEAGSSLLSDALSSSHTQLLHKGFLEHLGEVDALGEGFGVKPGGEGDGAADGAVFFGHADGGHENIDENRALISFQLDVFKRSSFRDGVVVFFHTPEVTAHGFSGVIEGFLLGIAAGDAAGQIGPGDRDLAIFVGKNGRVNIRLVLFHINPPVCARHYVLLTVYDALISGNTISNKV